MSFWKLFLVGLVFALAQRAVAEGRREVPCPPDQPTGICFEELTDPEMDRQLQDEALCDDPDCSRGPLPVKGAEWVEAPLASESAKVMERTIYDREPLQARGREVGYNTHLSANGEPCSPSDPSCQSFWQEARRSVESEERLALQREREIRRQNELETENARRYELNWRREFSRELENSRRYSLTSSREFVRNGTTISREARSWIRDLDRVRH